MIDWQQIESLRGEIGAEDFGEVVPLFLDEIAERLASLDDLDGPAARRAALHDMKGCALNLGLSDFAALCAGGEKAGGGDVAGLDRAFAAGRAALLDGIAGRFPG
ncbi:Hpt domain-containing protein [Roseivivax sp. CAU 1761]